MSRLDRRAYAAMYGPTTGDRIALGDTGLVVEVERDFASYGDQPPVPSPESLFPICAGRLVLLE